MKFPRKVWVAISQAYIEENMRWEWTVTDPEKIISAMCHRIEYAEDQAVKTALRMLLKTEGLELV